MHHEVITSGGVLLKGATRAYALSGGISETAQGAANMLPGKPEVETEEVEVVVVEDEEEVVTVADTVIPPTEEDADAMRGVVSLPADTVVEEEKPGMAV